jgi:hypothetical protein
VLHSECPIAMQRWCDYSADCYLASFPSATWKLALERHAWAIAQLQEGRWGA